MNLIVLELNNYTTAEKKEIENYTFILNTYA